MSTQRSGERAPCWGQVHCTFPQPRLCCMAGVGRDERWSQSLAESLTNRDAESHSGHHRSRNAGTHVADGVLLSKQAELLPRGLYGYGREGDWLQTKQVTSHSTSTRAGRSGKKQGSIPSGDIRLRGADKLGSTTKGRPAAKAASGNTELLQEMGVARSRIFAFTGCCGSGK